MTILKTDLAVVGGGPAGLISSRTAAEEGINVHLFDTKENIGFHEHCAGLLSIQGLHTLDLNDLPKDLIQNDSVKGAKIYSPSGKELLVSKNQRTAYVVNRAKFDRYLYNLALESGVTIHHSSKVFKIERLKESVILELGKKNNHRKIQSSLAILAEGRFPMLNKQVGLPLPRRDKIVFSSMYIMKGIRNIDPEYVEIYQDQKFAPEFFSWIIPLDTTTAKVGLASSQTPASDSLNRFIKGHPTAKVKLQNATIVKRMNGAIPLGSSIKRTYSNNILVVGDAAGQTKPTTGGGVIFGGIAAKFAGQIASDGIKQNRLDRRFLSKYSKLWKKELSYNLMVMKLVRKYIDRLTEKEVDILFQFLDRQKFKKIISERGDVDNQKELVIKLLTELRLWPFLMKTGFRILKK